MRITFYKDNNLYLYLLFAAEQLWYKYSWCRTRKSKHDCLPVVIGACRQSRIRVIKLVRLGLDIAAPLLEKDGTLKLVHLFRDPRGTIASRLVKTRWYPLFIANDDYSRVMKNAEILCKRMLKDFEAGSELIGRFPNRVKLIRYEDLNGNDDDVTFKVKDELRKFLDLIANSYTQKSKSKSSNDWIRLLNWKVIEIVDSVCYPVYQKLGYIRLDYQTWLNNRSGLTIPWPMPWDAYNWYTYTIWALLWYIW